MSRTSDRTYQRRRARLKREGEVCWQCHREIDQSLPWKHPLSWTADHVIPMHQGGSNHGQLMPAHRACNQARNRTAQPVTHHSRQW